MLGLGLSLTTGGVATPAYVVLAKAFVSRVEADGGTVDSFACLKTDMAYLTSNPDAPAGYTVEWSSATVGSSAEFRINLVGGAGYTYTYAVTDTQATEVTGTGVMGGDIQAVTADLSTLVDGTVTLAVYLTGAGGDGNVVTDTANLVGYTGLLDTYSGAAAAYSLRLLDTSYTGDAIVVRRASDSATQAIGFVNNELDTTSLESFCSGTDGYVTTWYDQSGNGNDATQTVSTTQPQIVSSGSTILENGKTAVEFSGSLTYLDASSAISDGFTNNSVYYKFEIAQVTITSKGGILSANAGYRGFFNPPSYDYANFHNPNGLSVISSLNVDRTNQFLFSELFDTSIGSGTYELYGNGSLERTEGSEGTSNLDTPTTLYIGRDPSGGASAYLNGKIQEIVFYNSDQSTNRTGIETNINDFYTIY